MEHKYVSIAPLLKKIANKSRGSGQELSEEIASAITYLFENELSPVQCASLLTALHLCGLEEDSHVIAACAQAMRKDVLRADEKALQAVICSRVRPRGLYGGGLCDIVGTGGDGHATFNVSTTASIICSSLLAVAKHGAQASSSKSGSADVLMAISPVGPNIEAVTAETIKNIYEKGNYGFLFAKQFHPGMKNVAPIRKEIGFRTIFNILGPLAHPLYRIVESGVYGVYKKSLGPVYAEALQLCGANKAMVVCGAEDLDEISCAGVTHCWRIISDSAEEHGQKVGGVAGRIETFDLQPSDFGLHQHRLDEVLPGRGPAENAQLLIRMLADELPEDHPTLEFVLMNAAALFVISGICDDDHGSDTQSEGGQIIEERGPGQGRWKEGVRKARWAIKSGAAAQSLQTFIHATLS